MSLSIPGLQTTLQILCSPREWGQGQEQGPRVLQAVKGRGKAKPGVPLG